MHIPIATPYAALHGARKTLESSLVRDGLVACRAKGWTDGWWAPSFMRSAARSGPAAAADGSTT